MSYERENTAQKTVVGTTAKALSKAKTLIKATQEPMSFVTVWSADRLNFSEDDYLPSESLDFAAPDEQRN